MAAGGRRVLTDVRAQAGSRLASGRWTPEAPPVGGGDRSVVMPTARRVPIGAFAGLAGGKEEAPRQRGFG